MAIEMIEEQTELSFMEQMAQELLLIKDQGGRLIIRVNIIHRNFKDSVPAVMELIEDEQILRTHTTELTRDAMIDIIEYVTDVFRETAFIPMLPRVMASIDDAFDNDEDVVSLNEGIQKHVFNASVFHGLASLIDIDVQGADRITISHSLSAEIFADTDEINRQQARELGISEDLLVPAKNVYIPLSSVTASSLESLTQ